MKRLLIALLACLILNPLYAASLDLNVSGDPYPFRVNSFGVGLGANAASGNKLQIAGNVYIANSYSLYTNSIYNAVGSADLTFQEPNNGRNIHLKSKGYIDFLVGSSYAQSLYVDSGALAVGIGTNTFAFSNGGAGLSISNANGASVMLTRGGSGFELHDTGSLLQLNDAGTTGSGIWVRNGNKVGIGGNNNPAARLEINSLATDTYALIVSSANASTKEFFVDGRDGLTYPQSAATATIQALAPKAAGGLIFSSTLNQLCVSTGTAAGAFARVGNQTTCW